MGIYREKTLVSSVDIAVSFIFGMDMIYENYEIMESVPHQKKKKRKETVYYLCHNLYSTYSMYTM